MAKKDKKPTGKPENEPPKLPQYTPPAQKTPPAPPIAAQPEPAPALPDLSPTYYTADAPTEENQALFRRLFKYIAGVALVIMSVMSFSYGISGDEQDMAEYGKKALNFYTSFGKDTSLYITPLDKDKVLRYYGAWFDVSAAIAVKVSPAWEYDTRHLLNSWIGWLGMLFAGLMAGQIAGWRAAIFGFLLLFFSPSYFGHSMNNPKDVPFAMAMMMSLYYFVRVLREMPAPKRSTMAMAALGIGLAIGARVGGLMLFGYLGVLFGLDWLRRSRWGSAKIFIARYALYGAIVAVAGFFVGMLFFPYGLQSPIAHTMKALAAASKFPVAIKEIYGGNLIVSSELPLTYLPYIMFITTPLLVWLALGAAAVLFPAMRRRYDWLPIFICFFAFAFPLTYIVYTDANVYGGWRHVLFTYPPLVVLAAVGIETILRLNTTRKVVQWATLGVVGISSITVSYWYVRSHPHQYTYYNELVGGIDGAYGNYELDYYFNSMRGTCDWFRANVLDKLPEGDSVVVASNATKQVNFYFEGDKRIKIVYTNYYNRNMIDWDYGVFAAKGVNPHHIQTGTFPHTGTIQTEKVGKAILSFCMKRPDKRDLQAFEANKTGKFAETIVFAQEYISQVDSNDAAVHNYLANALLQTGQIEKAEATARHVLELHPRHTGGLGVLGQIQMQQGKIDEAITSFRTLLIDDRNTFWAHYFLAVCYYNQNKNCERAIAHIDTCINLNRTFRDAYTQGITMATQCGYRQKVSVYQNELLKLK